VTHGKTQVDQAFHFLIVALMFCILGAISSFPWNMISVILAIIIIGFAYSQWTKARKRESIERERQEKLKHPFEIHFLIPKATQHRVGYYQQDGGEHFPDELTLPSNSENDVMVWMKPHLNIVLSELQFGCIGDDNETKPEPMESFNPFVKEGLRQQVSPKTDVNHYKDWQNYYHIMLQDKARPKGEVLITGLKVKTKKKGAFKFWVGFIMPETRGDDYLTLNVE
jgi:hypothetical protein